MKKERSYKELLEYGKVRLQEAEIEEYALDAWLLLEYVFQVSRTWYFVHENDMADTEKAEQYLEYIGERSRHVPLQQLTGEAYFYGMKFYVNEDVLIPRQDTEVLVEEVLKLSRTVFPEEKRKHLNILDVCTGSGCILLSLLSNLENAVGTGVDLSEKALNVARINGRNLGIQAEWIHSNLFDKVQGKYDMIVSNPPYIKTSVIGELMDEVKYHEPKMALDGREDGLYFYRAMIREAEEYLNQGGILAFEIGYDQGESVSRLMRDQGYSQVQVIPDLAGLDRCVTGIRK
nr:peptide chain release factor N(5)-glutamine methyltransferase [uncultured Blautia sp.]